MTTRNSRFYTKVGSLIVILVAVVLYTGCARGQLQVNNAPTPQDNAIQKKAWNPTGYMGIEIGKSSRDDIVKTFGKPLAEADEELEGEEQDVKRQLTIHSGKRLMLYYKDTGNPKATLNFYIGDKDKIVRAIAIYPNETITKASIIAKYGSDFIELGAGETICLANETNQGTVASQMTSPSTLVYPQLGMYVSLYEKEKTVEHFGYLLTCQE